MYEFSGRVIRGEGRGRQLGFPTANLDTTNLPLNYGVYLVEVKIAQQLYQGLLHFGPKKTFNNLISTEVYVSGFFTVEGHKSPTIQKAGGFYNDIYGIIIKIKVIKRIRSIKKFNSAEALIKQLEQDKLSLK